MGAAVAGGSGGIGSGQGDDSGRVGLVWFGSIWFDRGNDHFGCKLSPVCAMGRCPDL